MKRFLLAFISIGILTVVNFYGDEIFYYVEETIEQYNYKNEQPNEYTLNYNVKYLHNHNNIMLTNRNDIVNSIYTLLNNNNQRIIRYCEDIYKDCSKDIKEIAKNEELLSYINSFIHPYNSFNTISFTYDNNKKIEFENTTIYSKEEINIIEPIINNIIEKNINNNMNNEEKIKTIHDYIINNAQYDLLKKDNINDTTYLSNKATGVLTQGYGICSGYADTMAIFLNKLNIPNYKISNDTHIWNLVYINNQWLHLDLTWDDPVSTNSNENILTYDYFLITTAKLHELDSSKEHYFNKQVYIEANY